MTTAGPVSKPEGYEAFRTISELAAYVGKSTRSLERWYQQGRLPTPTRMENGTKLWSPHQCAEVLEMCLAQTPSGRARSRRIT